MDSPGLLAHAGDDARAFSQAIDDFSPVGVGKAYPHLVSHQLTSFEGP